MDWRQGSYIHQHYKNNENLSDRSLVEDIEIFMVDNYQDSWSWYDRIFILELKFKLLNESKNYRKISQQERFTKSENVVKYIIETYNDGTRYRDVERHVSRSIERHKKASEIYGGYGHYGYIR
jgi:hypothetical protein